MNGTGKFVTCYNCGGKGWVIPPYGSLEVPGPVPKPPRECRLCSGTGQVEVRSPTGRLAIEDRKPNLQNIPIRTELGAKIRKALRTNWSRWNGFED